MHLPNVGEEPVHSDDRLTKFAFWTSHLNNAMLKVFFSSKTLSVDQMMMPIKVGLVFRQCIESNKKKYGVKFFEVSTSNGLV